MIRVNEDLCPRDHQCPMIRQCPVNAIKQEGFSAPQVNNDACVGCQKCVLSCPYGVFYSDD